MDFENLVMPESDWKVEYAKQRKNRLQDSVDEYLQDDEVDVETFYSDLKACIDEIIQYHKTQKYRACDAMSMILGHRNVSFDEPQVDKQNSYEYAANITLSDIAKFHRGSTL